MRYHFGDGVKRQGQEQRRGKQKKENGAGEQLKETRIKSTIENQEWRVKNVTEKKNEI